MFLLLIFCAMSLSNVNLSNVNLNCSSLTCGDCLVNEYCVYCKDPEGCFNSGGGELCHETWSHCEGSSDVLLVILILLLVFCLGMLVLHLWCPWLTDENDEADQTDQTDQTNGCCEKCRMRTVSRQ
jgi:hypothetical protein